MTVLVFGGSGQVGREIGRQVDILAPGRDRADLSEPEGCAALIAEIRPRAVINAAAYTAVDAAEGDAARAHLVNADAPAAMARACAGQDIPFLHVSTDYVFDGQGTRPWREDDPTGPLNVYGRSKLAGETAIRAAGARHAILRTSWVFSAHGTNFVKTMLRLGAERDSLRVVDDQIGGPTPAAAIAATLLRMTEALCAGRPGGLYHYAGHPFTSWKGFAQEIFDRAGCAVRLEGIATDDYPTPAPRPRNSRLDCTRLEAEFGISPPDWRAGLTDVLEELSA